MSRLVLAIALGVAGVAACGGKGASGPAVVAGAPAGKVTAVQGAVTAIRGDARRPLAAGDAVSGDDVIETGADGRVTITLDHNQVPFSLGPERHQEVGKSPAWSAPKGTTVAVTSTDRSGAAGRHAEREAADTMASAPGAAAPAMPAPEAPPAPEAMAPPAAMSAPVASMDQPSGGGGAATGKRAAARAVTSVDDEVALDPPPPPAPPPPPLDEPKGSATLTTDDGVAADVDVARALADDKPDLRRKIVGQAGRGESITAVQATGGGSTRLVASIDPVDITGGLTRDVVLKKVRSRGLSLRECAGAAPAVTRYELTLTVAPSGAVSASKATGGSADVESCLAKTLGALTFPTAGSATTARLRLDLVAR